MRNTPTARSTRSKTLVTQSTAKTQKRKSAAGNTESPASKTLADETMQEIPRSATSQLVAAIDKMQENYCKGMQTMVTAIQELSARMDKLEDIIIKTNEPQTHTDHVTMTGNDKDQDTGDIQNLISRIDNLEDMIRSKCTPHTLTSTDDGLSTITVTQELATTVNRLEAKMDESTRKIRIKEAASSIKYENQVIWKSTMNKRKQCYWHALQNRRKAELYESWRTESPNYLPLKYRPKVNNHDCEESTNQKIDIARQQYIDDIGLMQHYSQTHSSRMQLLDTEFSELLSRTTGDEDIKQQLIKMWFQEASINEAISEQLWIKRQDFLSRKKEEDEATNSHQVTRTDDTRHQVKLKGKSRKFGPDPSSQHYSQSWRP